MIKFSDTRPDHVGGGFAKTRRWHGVLHAFSRLFAWVDGCIDRRRQRQALLELDDRMLTDIGLTRREAKLEGARPFWEKSPRCSADAEVMP